MYIPKNQFRIVKVLVSIRENVGNNAPASIVVLTTVNTSGLPTIVNNVLLRYVKEIVSLTTITTSEISTRGNDGYDN